VKIRTRSAELRTIRRTILARAPARSKPPHASGPHAARIMHSHENKWDRSVQLAWRKVLRHNANRKRRSVLRVIWLTFE